MAVAHHHMVIMTCIYITRTFILLNHLWLTLSKHLRKFLICSVLVDLNIFPVSYLFFIN